MTDPERIDVRELIQKILDHGKSFYYIAKLMRRQVIQIQRMHRSGRCQPYERDMLMVILDDCEKTDSRETLRNVTISSTQQET